MTASPRRRLSAQARRDEIVATALRLFAAAPYASVTLADVAAAVGVSTPLVHHHFGTKQDLYREVVRSAQDALRTRTLAALGPDTDDPGLRLRRSVEAFLAWVAEYPQGWLAVKRGGDAPAAAGVADLVEAFRAELLAGLRGAVLALPDPPPTVLLDLALEGYLGFVDALALAWLAAPAPRPGAEVSAAMAASALGAALAVARRHPFAEGDRGM